MVDDKREFFFLVWPYSCIHGFYESESSSVSVCVCVCVCGVSVVVYLLTLDIVLLYFFLYHKMTLSVYIMLFLGITFRKMNKIWCCCSHCVDA